MQCLDAVIDMFGKFEFMESVCIKMAHRLKCSILKKIKLGRTIS